MDDVSLVVANDFKNVLSKVWKESEDTPLPDVSAFHACMIEPLDPKVSKYAKAVSRILKEPACLYNAVEYKDAAALKGAPLLTGLVLLDPADTDRSSHWKMLGLACRYAQLACMQAYVRSPTPAEIHENIEQTRASRRAALSPSNVSMTHAFRSGLEALAKHAGEHSAEMATRVRAASEDEIKEVCNHWASALSGEGVEDALRDQNPEPLLDVEWPFLTDEERGALRASLQGPNSSNAFSTLNQLVSFTRVHQHIPTNMMSQIEKTAADLAASISSGQQSLDSLDLTKIGESVLKNCSESDMAEVAQNINKLLPQMGNLQNALRAS